MTLDYNQIKIFKKIVKISFLLIFQIPILVIYLSTRITHHSVRLRFQKDFTQVHIIMLHTFFIYIWYTLHKSRFSFFLSFFHSVSDFLGFQLVKALASGSGSGIPLNQDIAPSKLRAQLSHATLRFLDWLSSAPLKNFISGVASRILIR